MNPETLILCGHLAKMDAKISDGQLTWTMVVRKLISPQLGGLPMHTPKRFLEAMMMCHEIDVIRQTAANLARQIIESSEGPGA